MALGKTALSGRVSSAGNESTVPFPTHIQEELVHIIQPITSTEMYKLPLSLSRKLMNHMSI